MSIDHPGYAEQQRLEAELAPPAVAAQEPVQPVAWMYEGIGDLTEGRVIARTLEELGGDIDMHPHAWQRTHPLYTTPPNLPTQQEVMRLARALEKHSYHAGLNEGRSGQFSVLADEARAALLAALAPLPKD